jgi:YjbE family integral membrane protein
MEMLSSSFFWVTLGQIMMINIVLSGDNAVVIAMASRSLPPRQQKQAILFGSFGAIFLRIVLTFFAVMLLDLPYLKLIGAILLGYIGVQMLVPEEAEEEIDGHAHMWAAIKTIIIADLIMSLDNVLGVAAAAKGNIVLLVIGLGISIPLIIYGSTFILKLMNRFPIIITLGGAVLGWVAGEMLVSDPSISGWVNSQMHWLHTFAPVIGALLVVALGKSIAAAKLAKINQLPEGQVTLPEDEEPAPPGYHWVHRMWRRLPDGTRDYAAYYGKLAFRHLEPISSRLRPARHKKS